MSSITYTDNVTVIPAAWLNDVNSLVYGAANFGDGTNFTGIVISSYTGTLTGCASAPTGSITYTKLSNIVILQVPTFTATSNATTKTITGMGASLKPTTQKYFLANTQDNGGSRVVSSCTLDTDGTITLYASPSRAAFTAAGTFTVDPFIIVYTTV